MKIYQSTNFNFFFFFRSLGVKSPFIEFKSEFEILSNNSISLNVSNTHDSTSPVLHRKGIENLGNNINQMDLKNRTIEENFIKNMSKYENFTLHEITRKPVQSTEKPIFNYDREITILDQDKFEDSDRDRKYIIPLALKNQADEPKKSPIFQESSSTNIDDLKRHILMLQNLTKSDNTFQSKFVVFPTLQKQQQSTTQSPQPKNDSTIKMRLQQFPIPISNLSRSRNHLNTPRQMALKSEQILRDTSSEFNRPDKITIVPQVFLQNDQTPMSDEEYQKEKDKKDIKINYNRRKNKLKSTTTSTTTTRTPSSRRPSRKQKNALRRKNNRKQDPCKNEGNNKKIFCNNATLINEQHSINKNKTFVAKNLSRNQNYTTTTYKLLINSNHQHAAISSLSSLNSVPTNNSNNLNDTRKLSRTVRSQKFNINNMKIVQNTSKDIIIPIHSEINANETIGDYKENIDLNPELCYQVGGLSYGQQKICALHTSIMPAISRGARAAIQVCLF